MSFEIDWNKLLEDEERLSEKVRAFLDHQFSQLTLPPYIKSLSVNSFSFGTVAPEVTIKHISDPYPEFYDELDEDEDEPDYARPPPSPTRDRSGSTSSLPSYTTDPPDLGDAHISNAPPPPPMESPPMTPNGGLHYFHPSPSNIFSSLRSPLYATLDNPQGYHTPGMTLPPPPPSRVSMLPASSTLPEDSTPRPGREDDTQLVLEVCYSGDMKLGVSATLLLNYPSPSFVSLPVKLTVTGLEVRSMAVLSYISKKVHFSFICDIDKDGDTVAQRGQERIDILKDIKIESEIGDQERNGPVLRNVGKVERFLLERLRALARDELAWPGWITFDFED